MSVEIDTVPNLLKVWREELELACPPENFAPHARERYKREHWLIEHIETAYKRTMDEAADLIQDYLDEIPLCSKAHNWLIRNGYQDRSYQAGVFCQEIVGGA